MAEPKAPKQLEALSYPVLAEVMLKAPSRDLLSRFVCLDQDLETADYALDDESDSSVARQLSDGLRAGREAYLMTARSAIPVADSIRGFYKEIGEECPYIGYISASRGRSF